MKKTLFLAIVAGMLLTLSLTGAAMAQSVTVENFSFELPGTEKQHNWENVPNWSSDTVATDSGVETAAQNGWVITDGQWGGFLMNSDTSVYNLTDHTISADEVFTLTLDTGANNAGGVDFKMILYYDDGGTRVQAATQTVLIPQSVPASTDIYEYSLSFSANGIPGSIGHKIGIELDNVDGDISWMSMDNVRLTSGGVNYYVDATGGNDSWNGNYPSCEGGVNGPWQTIAKVNGENFVPGDTISFKCGEIWHEQLTVPNSGVEGSPVTFDSYGTGDKPLINVSETITNWSVHSGNIYVAPVSFDVHQVFLDDAHMILAHHPNDSFLWTDGKSQQTEDYYYVCDADHGLTSEQLIGADMNIRTSPWKVDFFQILDYDPVTHKFTMGVSGSNESENDSYFLANKLWMLDSPGEWYYESGSLYVWMPDGSNPSSHKVEATRYWYGIYARNKEYIATDGFEIRNAGHTGVGLFNTNKFSLTNLNIINIGSMKYYNPWEHVGAGIFIYNSSGMSDTAGEIIGNTIRNTFSNGLRSIWIPNLVVADNIVENIAMVGTDHYFPARGIGIQTSGGNVTIRENKVDDISYIGILFTGPDSLVEKNCINNSCDCLSDCGGIYTSRTDSNGNEISRNIITNTGNHNTNTMGIYLDDRSTGVLVSDNTVSFVRIGIHNHNSNNNTLTNNTIYDCKWSVAMQEDNIVEDDLCDIVFENNIYFTKIDEALVGTGDFREPIFFQDFADHDYNTYSGRNSGKVIAEWGSNYPLKYYSLSEWQDARGQDLHSRFVAQSTTIDPCEYSMILINTDSTSRQFSYDDYAIPGKEYVDLNGDLISWPITLDGYSSQIITQATCENQGYHCCSSCFTGHYPEYDCDCAGLMCCQSCIPLLTLPQDGWELWYCDSEEMGDVDRPATNSFDGDPNTIWHTEWSLTDPDPCHPHEIQIDLGDSYELGGFRYLPRQDDNENGMIDEYEFYVSTSGTDWEQLTPVASGNFVANKTEKTVLFNITQGQYVRLIALSEVNEEAWTTMAELNVLYYSPGELTDLNDDGTVNLEDFAVLACCWDDDGGCVEPDWCEGSDFNMSGTVDMFDLAFFAENWLRQAN